MRFSPKLSPLHNGKHVGIEMKWGLALLFDSRNGALCKMFSHTCWAHLHTSAWSDWPTNGASPTKKWARKARCETSITYTKFRQLFALGFNFGMHETQMVVCLDMAGVERLVWGAIGNTLFHSSFPLLRLGFIGASWGDRSINSGVGEIFHTRLVVDWCGCAERVNAVLDGPVY